MEREHKVAHLSAHFHGAFEGERVGMWAQDRLCLCGSRTNVDRGTRPSSVWTALAGDTLCPSWFYAAALQGVPVGPLAPKEVPVPSRPSSLGILLGARQISRSSGRRQGPRWLEWADAGGRGRASLLRRSAGVSLGRESS